MPFQRDLLEKLVFVDSTHARATRQCVIASSRPANMMFIFDTLVTR